MTATATGETASDPSATEAPDVAPPVARATRIGVLFALVVVAAGLSFVGTNWLYPTLTADHDEPVFLLQAENFADGHLTFSADDYGEAFRPWLSGERSGRLFLVFPPGWPAAMALSLAVFGTADVAVALVAASLPLLTFAFVREVWPDERVALVAAGAMVLSPFVMMQSATHLSYLAALPLELLALWTIARGVRRSRSGSGWGWSPVVAGLALGLLFTTRPLDALLMGLTAGVFVLVSLWPEPRRLPALVGAAGRVVAGAAVPVALLALYNLQLTGNPVVFPLAAAGGNNSFGFGERWITDGAPIETVTPGESLKAMGLNLTELPFWIWGGLLALGAVIWGAVIIWGRSRALAAMLLTIALAFPLVNLFYWGNTLVVLGRKSLGPLYYMPLLIPIVVATAVWLVGLYDYRRLYAVGLVIVFTGMTFAVDMPPKVSDALELRDDHRDEIDPVEEAAAATDEDVLVIIPPSEDGAWILHPRPYFANPPGLDGDILYATDQGNGNIELVEQFASRVPFQLMPRADGELLDPVRVPKRLELVSAPAIEITSEITNTGGGGVVSAYATGPEGLEQCVLDRSSNPGDEYEVTWIVDDEGPRLATTCPNEPLVVESEPDVQRQLVIGVGIGGVDDLEVASKSEYRIPIRARRGSVDLLAPGVPWALLFLDEGKTPVSVDVSPTQRISFEPVES